MVKWLTSRQVAETTGYNLKYLQNKLVHRADFPKSFKPAGRRLWRQQDITKWVEENHGS